MSTPSGKEREAAEAVIDCAQRFVRAHSQTRLPLDVACFIVDLDELLDIYRSVRLEAEA